MDVIKGLYIVVLTLNEEFKLKQCLRSASFAEKVIVVDSGSTDDTTAIARSSGADVHVHTDWQGFGVQRNRALTYCSAAEYIFFLDADEIITKQLQNEIREIVKSGAERAWTVEWNYIAFGKTLDLMKSTRGMLRFFYAKQLMGFEGQVHERAQLKRGTSIGALRNRLIHHSIDSVSSGLSKLRQYALLGALKLKDQGKTGGVMRGAVSATAIFLKLYILKRAFLHGGEGFLFCYFLAQERFFRNAALRYDRDDLTKNISR